MSHNITIEGGKTVRLPTSGKYCDRDIVITAEGGTEDLNAVLTEQESLIAELKDTLRGKTDGGGGANTELEDAFLTRNTERIQVNNAELREVIEMAEKLPDAGQGGNNSSVLVYDYTFVDESMVPTAYDAATGVFTVESIPEWARIANNYYKVPCCQPQYKLTIGAMDGNKLPDRPSQTYGVLHFTEIVDETHIKLYSRKDMTTLAKFPTTLDVNLFTFEKVDFMKSFDLSDWKRFRIEGYNTSVVLGYYDAAINTKLRTPAVAMGYINNQNALTGSFVQELEWVDNTCRSVKGWQESMCLTKNGQSFKENSMPKLYSVQDCSIRESGIIRIGETANSVIMNGSNIKIYGLEPWDTNG